MGKKNNKRDNDDLLADAYADRAVELYGSDTPPAGVPKIDFDDELEVELSEDGDGAWVQAWVHIPRGELRLAADAASTN